MCANVNLKVNFKVYLPNSEQRCKLAMDVDRCDRSSKRSGSGLQFPLCIVTIAGIGH